MHTKCRGTWRSTHRFWEVVSQATAVLSSYPAKRSDPDAE